VQPFFKSFLQFLGREKKWWLIPLALFALLVAALLWFTQGPAPLSPFMYSTGH